MRPTFTLALLIFALTVSIAHAQTDVGYGSFAFSSGIHPTFSFIFEGTDAKTIEGFWRDELKHISQDVSNKKEVIGSGALLPGVSPDTVRVLVKADQRKGSPLVTAHVAILTKAGWLGPESEAKAVDAATAFVQEKSTALRRELAQRAVEKGDKELKRFQDELAGMVREKERAEATIEKSNQRASEAALEQERARKELADLEPKLVDQRATNTTSPTEENAKALAGLMKQQTRLTDKLRRAQDEERSMKKKVEDLTWAISKNVEDQGRKTTEVSAQEAVVKELREKLEAIH